MKIINPNYKDTREEKIIRRIKEFNLQIESYIASLPANVETIDFETIRQDISAMKLTDSNGEMLMASDITDGIIDMICQTKGIEVIE